MSKTQPKLVVIGGGTGSFTILQELKNHPVTITALVNMVDDGGSTGLLRDELGVLPPGDIRQCLVALSQSSEELRQLFNFRFPADSSLAGHSFGNLFLSAVERMTDDFSDAVRIAGDVLQIQGRVLPVTLTNCRLQLKLQDQIIVGQRQIEELNLLPHSKPQLSLTPAAQLHPQAAQAIAEADMIVIAPGNLYASLAPTLLVEGLTTALQASHAPLVFVCNLVNKQQHTADFTVNDYADEIERFIGPGILSTVLYNTDAPSATLLKNYALEGEYPVLLPTNLQDMQHSYQLIGGSFLSHSVHVRDQNDTLLKRSLIRHDPVLISQALLELLPSHS